VPGQARAGGLVYVHDADEYQDQGINKAVPALVSRREQGIVGAIGVGMNDWRWLLRAVRKTLVEVVTLAGRWTLLDRSGRQLLDECLQRNVSVTAAAPYNSGLLAQPGPAPDATFDYRAAGAALIQRATRLADICERHGVRLSAAALRFPLRHPAVAAVVAGTRDAKEVHEAVDRLNTTIPEQLWQELNA
jgi:D-threo-aldose 1-dehydrogenase